MRKDVKISERMKIEGTDRMLKYSVETVGNINSNKSIAIRVDSEHGSITVRMDHWDRLKKMVDEAIRSDRSFPVDGDQP